jgi:outer membrane protein
MNLGPARTALPFALALGAALLVAPRSADADGAKIAVVDMQHAVMQTEDGIRAQATLKKLFDRRQQELDAKQTELQGARGDIEKQSMVLSHEALTKRTEDWQRRMIELQQKYLEYNKELQSKQGEKTAPIIKKMVGIIGKIAKKNGYELIVDKQVVHYARPDLDLTEQVVQTYNSGDAGDSGGDDAKKDDKKK